MPKTVFLPLMTFLVSKLLTLDQMDINNMIGNCIGYLMFFLNNF